jgi:bifunctional DNA-binding transcriptional regulator/antitoxin component of YhaV-PrlF toxin-antitoxin module
MMRKRLGIEEGDILIAKEREGDIVLRPAAVLEIEPYRDDPEIASYGRGGAYKGLPLNGKDERIFSVTVNLLMDYRADKLLNGLKTK